MTKIPGRVRIASVLTWMMAPAGLLLLADGLLELHWWSTAATARLMALFKEIRTVDNGPVQPILLRGRVGAIELVILGAATAACALLTGRIRAGQQRSRTQAMALTAVLAFVGMTFIGIDVAGPPDIPAYYHALVDSTMSARIPQIQALIYPGWYGWAEDTTQELQVLVSIAALVSLWSVAIWDPDYSASPASGPAGGPAAESAEPDAWDAAISRIRRKNQPPPDPNLRR